MKEEAATLPLLLKQLRLPTMTRHFELLGRRAIEDGWSPLRYLKELCERELNGREDRRLARHLLESQ
jgi:DNA replication protein DnaC